MAGVFYLGTLSNWLARGTVNPVLVFLRLAGSNPAVPTIYCDCIRRGMQIGEAKRLISVRWKHSMGSSPIPCTESG